jgi:hypothetical protein
MPLQVNPGNKKCVLCKKNKKDTPATYGRSEKKAGGTAVDVPYCAKCAPVDCVGEMHYYMHLYLSIN